MQNGVDVAVCSRHPESAPELAELAAAEPILDELQAEFEDKINIIKVNVDNSMDIAEQYNISNIPALVLLKKGQEVQRLIGFSPKQVIKENIEKHL